MLEWFVCTVLVLRIWRQAFNIFHTFAHFGCVFAKTFEVWLRDGVHSIDLGLNVAAIKEYIY